MFRLNSVLEEMLTTSHGICPTRRELFGQLYEELIRQEMISCKVERCNSDHCISLVVGERSAATEDKDRTKTNPDVVPGTIHQQ